MEGNKIVRGFVWKLLERFGVTSIQFILQIILARIIEQELYGTLSIMIIFTTLANVFVQNGFNSSLVQAKDVDEEDYSSVFWVSFIIAGILYCLIFICAPFIAGFYKMYNLVSPLRVLALILFPGVLNSIQIAMLSRKMDFRKIFYSNIAGIIISGVLGIYIAYLGGGLWALVVQILINSTVSCIVMTVYSGFRLKFVCNIKRIKRLFSFGWKLLLSSLIDTLYQDLRSLVIGKKYNGETLAYYERGKQFPQFINNTIYGAVQSVMLPAMSREQDDSKVVKEIMRNSIMISSFIVFPIMIGLASVAVPLVSVILTDKWLPCVPFLQIYCITFAFYPVHSCNLQAINAIGRSDIFLKLEIIKKSYGIVMLIIAIFCFESPIAIAATGLFTSGIGWFVNAYPNKKLIGYSYKEQIKDILPSIVLTILMCIVVIVIVRFEFVPILTLILGILVGILTYVCFAMIVRPPAYKLLMGYIVMFAKKKGNSRS